jgi:alanine racemase
MGGLEPADAPAIVEHRLTPVLWTPGQVYFLDDAAARAGHHLHVHLEVDTGMARQGAAPGPELECVLDALRHSRWLRVEGAFSHLSSSEVHHSRQTANQLASYRRGMDIIAAADFFPEWLHLANSAALDEGSSLRWLHSLAQEVSARVLVRPGLSLFGYCLTGGDENRGASQSQSLRSQLHPVLSWKTRILSTREIAPGQTVGYGGSFIADRPMRLALLPVGYADGFRRDASSSLGAGWVVIAGQRAPVVGRVSMNLTVVDVTLMPEATPGAEVTLLGDGVSADDHARWSNTIPYDILCGPRAHRRLVQ